MNSLVHSFAAAHRPPTLAIHTRRSYRIAAQRLEYDERHAHASGSGASVSQAALRERTDVLLLGHAYGAAPYVETVVAVGDSIKRVGVHGHRHVRVVDGKLSVSATESAERVPLDWSHAYGGRDDSLAGEVTCSYPRNAEGTGFWLDRAVERHDGRAMPNLEDPTDPVTPERLLAQSPLDWLDRPVAASYSPLDELTFPRSAHVIYPLLRAVSVRPARAIHELTTGVLSERDLVDKPLAGPPDPRIYNRAPAGLATTLLAGNERLLLVNVHRERRRIEVDLPGERPRLFVEPPNTRAYELKARLVEVLIEPDEDRVTLTWVGAMPVAAVFPEALCRTMRHAVSFD